MRTCSRCALTKPDDGFGTHKSWCSQCVREYGAKWRAGLREPRRGQFAKVEGKVVCSRCGESEERKFYPSQLTRYRKGRRIETSLCRACHRKFFVAKGNEYMQRFQKRLRAQKRKYLRDFKESKGCAHCGDKRWQVLHFHHTDPNIKSGVLNAMAAQNAAWERIDEEIEKCDVLCANCHAMEHYRIRTEKKAKEA